MIIGDIQRSVEGALKLARGDSAGLQLFDLSIDGFYRSFVAAPLAYPAYLLLTMAGPANFGAPADVGAEEPAAAASYLISAIGFLIAWLVFPIASIFLTRFYGLQHRYVPLVVAANWAALVQGYAFLAAILIGGLLGQAVGPVLVLTVMGALLVYDWFVIRVALETTSAVAASFVAADLALSLVVSRITAAVLSA
jgi:hypothetical protein